MKFKKILSIIIASPFILFGFLFVLFGESVELGCELAETFIKKIKR